MVKYFHHSKDLSFFQIACMGTIFFHRSSSLPSSFLSNTPIDKMAESDDQKRCNFLAKNNGIEFVWFQFMPYHGVALVRMVPVTQFTHMLQTGSWPTITACVTHLLLNDTLATGTDPVGAMHLKPDISTAICQTTAGSKKAVMMTSWVDPDGNPLPVCPRSKLHALTDQLRQEPGFSPLVGFEVEVVFLQVDPEGHDYSLTDKNHSWSSMTAEDYSLFPMVEEIVRTLLEIGIEIQQFHAESGPGQWEFVLPANEPVPAVDMLIHVRKTIEIIAAKHGLRATLHPRLSNQHAGNASHVHISVNPTTTTNPSATSQSQHKAESFFAGILAHLPAILAFTLPQDCSYERVKTGVWTGGEYADWGWQNRETPLRRINHNRFEFKLLDGLANPYLALSAILAGGLDGVRRELELTAGDCRRSPGLMSKAERQALGVTTLLPKSIQTSLDCLVADEGLCGELEPEMTGCYIELKKGEAEFLNMMTLQERKIWLVSKY